MSCLIFESRRGAVERGLMAAFGTAELDAIAPISGGLSGAAIFRIRVGGIAYLLRIEGERDRFRDPVRGYACMRTAASAYLAPRVRYADAADGVAIMDLVPARSLVLDYPGAGHELVIELAQAVRALHETPAFPPLVDYLDGMDALIGLQRASGLLDPAATDEVFARYGDLRRVYRTPAGDLVSSHNDLNPGNVLYDGTRLWLVDWEAAFLADRYVDLAAVANWFTSDADGEAALLRTYFGAPPDAARRARLFLMRQVNHLFYGIMFLNGAAAERPGARSAEATLAGPSVAELRQGLAAGEFDLQAWHHRVAYGRACLGAAVANMRTAAFADAMETLVSSSIPKFAKASGKRLRTSESGH